MSTAVHGKGFLVPGAAQVAAEAVVRKRGKVVEEQEWARAVQLELAP